MMGSMDYQHGYALLAAVGEAAAPPVVVFAFLGEGLIEAPTAGFDAAVEAEPERDGEKSSDESESGGVAESDACGAGEAREERAVISESGADVDGVGERENRGEEAEESADAKEKGVPSVLGFNVGHVGKVNLAHKILLGKYFRDECAMLCNSEMARVLCARTNQNPDSSLSRRNGRDARNDSMKRRCANNGWELGLEAARPQGEILRYAQDDRSTASGAILQGHQAKEIGGRPEFKFRGFSSQP